MKKDHIGQLIKKLKLEPLPDEGGLYSETYRSDLILKKESLPEEYGGGRCISTAIYYMLTSSALRVSKLHKIRSDEIYHFYSGDPVALLLLHQDGNSEQVILGKDILGGQHVQYIVPCGVWQGSHLLPGGEYALLGTTVSPGFDFKDSTIAKRNELLKTYPDESALIMKLT